jgi:hypothetical protein
MDVMGRLVKCNVVSLGSRSRTSRARGLVRSNLTKLPVLEWTYAHTVAALNMLLMKEEGEGGGKISGMLDHRTELVKQRRITHQDVQETERP